MSDGFPRTNWDTGVGGVSCIQLLAWIFGICYALSIFLFLEFFLICKAPKGLCKKIPKIRDYYGSGWVGPGLTSARH